MLKNRLGRQIKKRVQRTFKPKTDVTLKYYKLNIEIEKRSTKIINLVGYVILSLVLLDYGFLLISSQLFDPTWAYNTAGKLVENVWGLLLGFIHIFYRCDQDIIKPTESFFLKIVSWFTLLVGIGYFLITPVIVGNGFRIYRSDQAQVISQIDIQKTQVEQYIQQLEGANEQQLNGLLQRYTVEQNSSAISKNSADKIKSKLLVEVRNQQIKAEGQLKTEFNQKKSNLFKTTAKWSIGAIISAMCFVLIWRYTQWARRIS